VDPGKPFGEALQHLNKARDFVCLALLIFLAGATAGYLYPENFTGYLDAFREFAGRFEGRSTLVLIAMIFLQNVSSAFLTFWLGTLLGLVPALGAFTNGILLGIILSVGIKGNIAVAMLTLLPHGIFELPAIFVAWGLGLWRGFWLFRKNKDETYRERARQSYRVFLTLVIPLLAVAAIIEGTGIGLLR
jgi:uncharacterized membrane protein SpoIIM required for sporulation